jgi:hypothetical protein
MRYLILLMSLFLGAFAESYNSGLVDMHAKVFPKILLSDTKIDDKLINGAIKIIILYSDEDITIANKLKTQMIRLYPLLKDHPFHVVLKEYQQFDPTEDATAYYELLGDKKAILTVNKTAQKNSRITFSYENDYLNYGTLMSLYVSDKVSPYISTEALKQSNIVLDNIIYKIAKIK